MYFTRTHVIAYNTHTRARTHARTQSNTYPQTEKHAQRERERERERERQRERETETERQRDRERQRERDVHARTLYFISISSSFIPFFPLFFLLPLSILRIPPVTAFFTHNCRLAST